MRSLLDWPGLISALENTFLFAAAGQVEQLPKQVVSVPGSANRLAVMPAATGRSLGAKVVTLFPGNRERGRAVIDGLMLLFDIDDGKPLAVLDAGSITAWRTAAVSAVAARALAPDRPRSLAVLGSGVQARHHVDALRSLFDFDDIRVWSRTAAHAESLADALGLRACAAKEAVQDADIVITATHAQRPVLEGVWLKPGALVIAVGWAGPESRELDAAALANQLVVDDRDAAMAESGSLRSSGSAAPCELADILTGKARVDPARTKIFISVGTAVADIASAQFVYDRALTRPRC